MKARKLGNIGPTVGEMGYGCMSLSGVYGSADDRAGNLALIRSAIDRGIDLLDTAEAYGPFTNEQLVGDALKGIDQRVTVATKFGFGINADGTRYGLDSRPDHIREVVDAMLARLARPRIDLLYQHRVDPNVPIEDVAETVGELITKGKVGYFGLSEASAETIRRAHAVQPVTAVQSEYSLWTRDVEHNGVLSTCEDLGIGFVPFSPLGAGFLTGKIDANTKLEASDFRAVSPRFESDARASNLRLVELLKRIAERKGATPAQIALAWLLAQKAWIVPIPGTRKLERLEENIAATQVSLDASDLDEIRATAERIEIQGARLPEAVLRLTNR